MAKKGGKSAQKGSRLLEDTRENILRNGGNSTQLLMFFEKNLVLERSILLGKIAKFGVWTIKLKKRHTFGVKVILRSCLEFSVKIY